MIKGVWRYSSLTGSVFAMKWKYTKIVMLVALITFPFVVQAYSAIVPTAGYLETTAGAYLDGITLYEETTSVTWDGRLGTFDAHSTASMPAAPINGTEPRMVTSEANATATINSNGLSFAVDSEGYKSFHYPSYEEALMAGVSTATVMFTIDEPTPIAFEWDGDIRNAEASLHNAAGDTFLSCYGKFNPYEAICFDGDLYHDLPSPQIIGDTGNFMLETGEYTVTVSASLDYATSLVWGGSGALTLLTSETVVAPIPAAIWLLGPSLIGLFTIKKCYRSTKNDG
jgi:hypothetical protein